MALSEPHQMAQNPQNWSKFSDKCRRTIWFFIRLQADKTCFAYILFVFVLHICIKKKCYEVSKRSINFVQLLRSEIISTAILSSVIPRLWLAQWLYAEGTYCNCEIAFVNRSILNEQGRKVSGIKETLMLWSILFQFYKIIQGDMLPLKSVFWKTGFPVVVYWCYSCSLLMN